ncbi:hypothetical protein A7Q01_07670 [Eikenella sp. NML96-A-049]|uniref:hypothetical protein n=1 Tax=unclassified Eikenella TaxID=2639367 RepID=UPI0007DF9ADC|nr:MULTISPECIES: hypothetical protein [unclassified Eikenella]OAM30481.1 hypothetical protein A7P96_07785 [Eikenella sp. NML03-A-027]OAM34544.1 hypothetical protein A7P97_05010 [Eikenella sp. NML070372]OAM39285.1 hypothetical protein A7Q01_07670 [Eikenella sp. NML96-A-049]
MTTSLYILELAAGASAGGGYPANELYQGNWSIPINIAYYYDKFKTHYDEEERHIIDDNDSINNNNQTP